MNGPNLTCIGCDERYAIEDSDATLPAKFCCQDCEDDHSERSFGPDYDYGDSDGMNDFADPGGNSALRAASASNPRNLPCPNCEQPDRLTPNDRALGYQCDACADRAERGGF